MNDAEHPQDQSDACSRSARALLVAWLALIALLLASLGSAYLSLGLFNPVLSIGIALLKSAIVVWLYMRMHRASALVRLAAASGVAILLLLASLTGVDYATRASTPAALQQPRQLQPMLEER